VSEKKKTVKFFRLSKQHAVTYEVIKKQKHGLPYRSKFKRITKKMWRNDI